MRKMLTRLLKAVIVSLLVFWSGSLLLIRVLGIDEPFREIIFLALVAVIFGIIAFNNKNENP